MVVTLLGDIGVDGLLPAIVVYTTLGGFTD